MDTTDTVTVTLATPADRVAAGIKWLRESGPGYGLDITRVDTSTMAITSGTRCVLAQADGSDVYGSVIARIDPRPYWNDWSSYEAWAQRTDAWARAHGFLPEYTRDDEDYLMDDADALTAEWRKQLPPAVR